MGRYRTGRAKRIRAKRASKVAAGTGGTHLVGFGMKYFAYGSNMLRERLLKRVPGATVTGLASVRGRILRFQKKSSDGSAKCDLARTQCDDDQAWGVLFEIPEAQIAVLDDAEGLGKG